MMTPAEVHLLEARRVAAIRFTIASLLSELAKIEADRQKRTPSALLARDCMDSRKFDMADS